MCSLPLLLGHAVFVVLGTVFPLLHMAAGWTAPGNAILSQVLTKAYSVLLVAVAALAPFVAKRQLLWVDVADVHGFPEFFYGPAVLLEIRKRHLRDSFLRQRLGHRLAQYTLSFLEDW